MIDFHLVIKRNNLQFEVKQNNYGVFLFIRL